MVTIEPRAELVPTSSGARAAPRMETEPDAALCTADVQFLLRSRESSSRGAEPAELEGRFFSASLAA